MRTTVPEDFIPMRSPEEERARTRCRSMAKELGTYIKKYENSHVTVGPCDQWPEGLTTSYHGWVDLEQRLILCREDPDLVIDGMYVASEYTDE